MEANIEKALKDAAAPFAARENARKAYEKALAEWKAFQERTEHERERLRTVKRDAYDRLMNAKQNAPSRKELTQLVMQALLVGKA